MRRSADIHPRSTQRVCTRQANATGSRSGWAVDPRGCIDRSTSLVQGTADATAGAEYDLGAGMTRLPVPRNDCGVLARATNRATTSAREVAPVGAPYCNCTEYYSFSSGFFTVDTYRRQVAKQSCVG